MVLLDRSGSGAEGHYREEKGEGPGPKGVVFGRRGEKDPGGLHFPFEFSAS